MSPTRTLTIALALAVVGIDAHAGPVGRETGPNLVTNGGFENSTTVAASGWTATGFFAEGFDYQIDAAPADAHTGVHSFAGGALGATGTLSQVLVTTPGTSYDIRFWLSNLSGFSDGTELDVSWNGRVVYTMTDILGSGYKEIVIDPAATGTRTTLAFGLRDDGAFLNIDDVSVRAIPEPGVAMLGVLGVVGAALARRRPRR